MATNAGIVTSRPMSYQALLHQTLKYVMQGTVTQDTATPSLQLSHLGPIHTRQCICHDKVLSTRPEIMQLIPVHLQVHVSLFALVNLRPFVGNLLQTVSSSTTKTEVVRTPSSTQPGSELMTSRSWQHISCQWDAHSNHSAINHSVCQFYLVFDMLMVGHCTSQPV